MRCAARRPGGIGSPFVTPAPATVWVHRHRSLEGSPMTNPLQRLSDAGQSVWLDFLNRRILENGDLRRLVEKDGLGGVTSNPAIFEKAIADGDAYDDALRALLRDGDAEVVDLYEALAIADIQAAADQLRPVWQARGGADGFVSLEVSPYLAHDTEATLAEALRLWKAVDRPNLMIKVPGTPAGVPAVRQLIGQGVNVNVTLLFSVDSYQAVAEAHVSGLEDFRAAGGDVGKVHGVASLFVSRIDGVVDQAIDARLVSAVGDEAATLKGLRGKVAIANARAAYRRYKDLIATPRWRALADAGASPQRLLWASTGTKDPAYSDVLYVETLIGPETVNTMPPATLDAFRDHGVVRDTLSAGDDDCLRILADAERMGLDLKAVTDELVVDGVAKFSDAFDQLLGAVARKRATILGRRLNGQTIAAGPLKGEWSAALARAAQEGATRRLWARDATLWTGGEEAKWLGWLDAATALSVDLSELDTLRSDVKAAGFTDALLLGMGGSSLGPEVIAATFPSAAGFPRLLVLDSTDPVQVARVAGEIDMAKTLFIVASKSGSTLEPDVLHRFFFERAEAALGKGKAGAHFLAITDPGSKLEAAAREQGFWRIFAGVPAIGGRYSLFSNFGMVPAAVIGLNVRAIFSETGAMVRSCGPSAPPVENPGFALGLLMGVAARAGRDKITFIASSGIANLGAWLEQLIAESTGKLGLGVIPVDGEPAATPDIYGADRVFAHLRVDGDSSVDQALAALEAAGHPVVRINIRGAEALFQEFFRWEVATAVAGAVLRIDPFDQPDVEASKIKTRALTDAYESTGVLPSQSPLLEADGLAIYADASNTDGLAPKVTSPSIEAYLRAHFDRAGPGDYIGILAYLDRNLENTEALQSLRLRLRDRAQVATVLEFGPRFLHSTGQAYKGGPNTGVFLQITADANADLPIPGRAFTFGIVEAAQAEGDFAVLAERGRRLLRVHLKSGVAAGLERLARAFDAAGL